MGNKQTIFSEIQLELYQDVTFFRRNEILRVFEVSDQPHDWLLDMRHDCSVVVVVVVVTGGTYLGMLFLKSVIICIFCGSRR